MSRFVTIVATSVALVVIAHAFGCNGGEDLGGLTFGAAAGADASTQPTSSTTKTCARDAATPYEKLDDPSTLPPCSPACAGAHCVPSDRLPADARSTFASIFAVCSGGYCIPDALIKSGGAKPPSCASLGGSAGVCLSVCVPQVGDNRDALSQATCAADERCAPCVNPSDGTSTGACRLGAGDACGDDAGPAASGDDAGPICPHVGPPILEPTKYAECGGAGSGAHCLSSSLVPKALVSSLATCSGGYCVPDKLIATAGNFIPATCTSLAGAEGRCQNTVLPGVSSQANLPQATCDANERCVPCFNPLDGKDTGACRTSCDPGPTKPAVILPKCCGDRGTCAPKEMVPAAQQAYLNACSNGDLCVPDENLAATFRPPTCSVDEFFYGYDGVCLSSCLKLPDGVERGDCDGAHTCVPCYDDDDNPTHAPGCP